MRAPGRQGASKSPKGWLCGLYRRRVLPSLDHGCFLPHVQAQHANGPSSPAAHAAIERAMAHTYLYGPSPVAECLLGRDMAALGSHETVLLPFIEQLLVPVVAGDVAMSHWLLCILARHADVGGILEDEPEAFLVGATLPASVDPSKRATQHGCLAPNERPTFHASMCADAHCSGLRARPVASSVALLVGHLHRYTSDLTLESPVTAQIAHVRLLGLCSLRHTTIDTLAAVRAQLAMLTQPIPSASLTAMLALAPPSVCHALFDFQQTSTRHHWDALGAVDAAVIERAAPLLSHTRSFFMSDGDVAAIWKALLSNDHFFLNNTTPGDLAAVGSSWSSVDAQTATMHTVLMRCLASVPMGSVVHHSNAQSTVLGQLDWTALLNKTSRVYLKRNRGSDLYALHQLLLTRFDGIELRMPPAYAMRVVGALFDEALELMNRDTGVARTVAAQHAAAWHRMMGLVQWALRLFRKQTSMQAELLQLCRKAALQFEPDSDVSHRLLQVYQVFYDSRCPALSHDKDAFQQLVRHVCLSLTQAGVLEPLKETLIEPLLSYMEADVTIKYTWLLDAAAALLSTIDAMQVAGAKSVGVWLVSAVHDRLLPARNVTGVNLLNISSIRKVLERIDAAPRSLFWWRCGCGAENPAGSVHCSACLRRARLGWCCTICATDQPLLSGKAPPSCCHCGATHPRLAVGAELGYRCCPLCKTMFDAEAGDCPACVTPQAGDGRPTTNDGSHQQSRQASATVCCVQCGKGMPLNAPMCPHCKARNLESNVKLWHCAQCHNYSYSTWSRCQRCRPDTPSVKAADALTIPFFLWTCGCGAGLQHPCRLSCDACNVTTMRGGPASSGASGGAFTCSACRKQSHCRDQQTLAVTSNDDAPISVLVTTCQHCRYPHPRDAHILTLPRALPRHCIHCAADYVPTSGNGMGPQVCTTCMRLQPVNPNVPFQCDASACHMCTAKRWQYGFACQACASLRRDVRVDGDVFVWKCVQDVALSLTRVPEAAAEDVAASSALGDADTVGACGTWNVSWEATCRGCQAARLHAPETEVRAKLLPWTCDACHTQHPGTTVLLCDACTVGLQPQPEPCASCGLRHLSLRCPTTEQLVEAERLLSALEMDAFELPPTHAVMSW